MIYTAVAEQAVGMLEEVEFVILEFYVLSCATVIILVSRWNLRDGIFLKYSQAILCLVKQIDKILFFKTRTVN